MARRCGIRTISHQGMIGNHVFDISAQFWQVISVQSFNTVTNFHENDTSQFFLNFLYETRFCLVFAGYSSVECSVQFSFTIITPNAVQVISPQQRDNHRANKDTHDNCFSARPSPCFNPIFVSNPPVSLLLILIYAVTNFAGTPRSSITLYSIFRSKLSYACLNLTNI